MCSTSRTSISPIRITTSHRSICCNQYLLKSSFNKSCVQQSSTIHKEPNLYKCCWCHGVMFSELSNPAGMPRFWVCTDLYSFQKCPEVNGIVVQYWTIIPGGIHQSSYEPITGVDRFDVFGIEICSSADWNAESGVNVPITLKECNGMS